VHLIPESLQKSHFPAIHTIKFSSPSAPEHYSLLDMILWATLPYAIWQLSYHFLITVRKRSKIAAGRPTSFTWLRRSYRGNFLGKFVLGFPESYQEWVFMGIQYVYALLTMTPCPIWFRSAYASAGFMLVVFAWASWNGATYYIDVFGRRMEKELEQLRKEVARMAKSPDLAGQDGSSQAFSPISSPNGPSGLEGANVATSSALDLGPPAAGGAGGIAPEHLTPGAVLETSLHHRGKSFDTTTTDEGGLSNLDNESEMEVDSQGGTPGAAEPGLIRTIDGGLASAHETPFAKLGEGKEEAKEYFGVRGEGHVKAE
jgi:hypothetical protein